MKKNFLGVVGHTNLDFVFDIPVFPDPQKHASVEIEEETLFFGGTAGNVARCAGSIGVKAGIASFVGDDFPDDYLHALKDSQLDLTDFKIMKGATPKCWVMTDPKGGQFSIINQGVMRNFPKYDLPTYTLENSEYLHLMTGDPATMIKIAEQAKKQKVKISFDPCQYTYWYTPDQFKKMLELADILFFNENEAKWVLDKIGKQYEKDFLEFADIVVITRHEKGSTIYTNHGKIIGIGIAKPAIFVDQTGAGDAYRAGFYLGLSKGFDLETCGKLAATVASFILEKVGTQTNIPTLEQVKKRYKENFSGELKL